MSGAPTREIRSGSRARGTVLPPPSKSVTNRALNLALLVDGPVEIVRPLVSEDTRAMTAALGRLGFEVRRTGSGLLVRETRGSEGPAGTEEVAIDCRASGTMLRFLAASLATRPGVWILDGVARLRERPMAPLIGALRQLGAEIECLRAEGFAPLRIRGATLRGGRCRLDAGASSQFLSALLMAAVRSKEGVSVETSALTSEPYVELTLEAMNGFGLRWRRSADRFEVAPQRSGTASFEVEADYSSACYFGAAAALTGGRLALQGLRAESKQGDARFFSVLERMGARCSWKGSTLEVVGAKRMQAVSESFADMPDQVPTLAVLAPFAEGTTRISGVGHLRLKESDRLAVVARGLARAGVEGVLEADAEIAVPGVWARAEAPNSPVAIDTADDHRIAMSFALLGLRREGVSIVEPDVVAKSYPEFWADFGAACES